MDVAVPDSMGAQPAAEVPMSEEPVMDAEKGGEDAEDSVASTAIPAGSVSWSIPAKILALDSAKAGPDEIRIPGFRVQLFMGRLDSARALRQTLLEEEEWAWPDVRHALTPVVRRDPREFHRKARGHAPVGRPETPVSDRPRRASVLAVWMRSIPLG